jgi:hypothetical protein
VKSQTRASALCGALAGLLRERLGRVPIDQEQFRAQRGAYVRARHLAYPPTAPVIRMRSPIKLMPMPPSPPLTLRFFLIHSRADAQGRSMAEYPGVGSERRFAHEVLDGVVRAIIERCGVAEGDAGVVADQLAKADLRGIHSQGVMRVPLHAAS